MSLTTEEKRDLRDLLVVVLPDDTSVRVSSEQDLNEDSLRLTEQFLQACTKCTKAMQELMLSIAGGLTRGWLRQALKRASKEVAKDDGMWRGNAACYVAAKSRFRSSIRSTVI